MSGIGDRSRAVLKGAARAVLKPFNLAITRVVTDTGCAREWVAESGLSGMAVNDYIEKDQRKPARQELERLVFSRVSPQATLCELGPGTGVYTRYLNDYVDGGRLHVVDADPSAVDFLRRHLPRKAGTELHCNSGTSLPIEADGSVDLVFCASMFTGGNLSYFYRYLQEFERVLKPGGWAVFDYHDVATEAGWQSLLRNMRRRQPIFAYAYHATDTVDRVLQHLGLEVQERWPTARGSVFVNARKPA